MSAVLTCPISRPCARRSPRSSPEMSNARKPALYAPMYSVSPATQTLCTPPYSGSYHATDFGCAMSLTSSTCSRPYARPAAASLAPFGYARGKHFVGDEDVVLVAPRGVRAANEAGAAVDFHLLVQRVQVVLVLRHELRIGRRPALDAVADVEHDEAVVPVARVQQAVADVDVVQRPAGVGTPVGLPRATSFG